MEQGTREIIREQEENLKEEQGAKRVKKEQWKLFKKKQGPKNEREQGQRGKMSKGAGSIDPT